MKNTQCVIRRAVTIVAALLLSNVSAKLELQVPPVVGATASTVFIDDSSERFKFYAPLFLGSHMQWMDVLYDTMSDWTVIDQDYDPDRSSTAVPWLDDDYNIYNDVQVGSQVYSGPIFNETMCLIRGDDDASENRLCVQSSPMVLAPIGDDLNGYQGVLGLSHGEMNYVRLLEEEKVLQKHVIALDYDTHEQHQSSVKFGDFDPAMTKDEKLYVVPNAGHSKWALTVTGAAFGDKQVSQDEKLAFIDSGNVTIQLPRDVYDQVYGEIKKLQYDHVKFREQYEFGQKVKIIKVNTECDDIVDDLPTLKLNVAPGLVVVLEPRSYVFPPKEGEFHCRISLAASNENVYRLGTQFLKNFYTVLDFDGKQIMLGSKSKHADVFGDESLIYQEPQPEPIPDPEPEPQPEQPDDDEHKDDQQEQPADDTGKTDEQEDDNKEEPQQPDDDQHQDESTDDNKDDEQEPHDDDEQHDQEQQPEDHHQQEEQHPEEPEKHEEDHHEEEHHEEEHHEEEHHDQPQPQPPKPQNVPKPAPPAKKKTFVDTYLIDPIMNPILGIIHFIQAEIDLVTNMILSPIKMLTSLKFF